MTIAHICTAHEAVTEVVHRKKWSALAMQPTMCPTRARKPEPIDTS